jgi:hypothetical protein
MIPTNTAARQVAGYVCSRGIPGSSIPDEQALIALASEMFEVPITEDVEKMASTIATLPRKERRIRANRYLHRTGRSQGRLTSGDSPAGFPHHSDWDAHTLLQKVVMAVLNNGHASDLYEFPDVLAYFGAQRAT